MADDWMYFLQTSSCRHTFQTLFFFCYPLASDAKHSKVFVTQSCPTLCISIDCSPPGSTVHRILQARILEWVAIPFYRGSSQTRDWTWVSCLGRRIFYYLSHQGCHNGVNSAKTLETMKTPNTFLVWKTRLGVRRPGLNTEADLSGSQPFLLQTEISDTIMFPFSPYNPWIYDSMNQKPVDSLSSLVYPYFGFTESPYLQ